MTRPGGSIVAGGSPGRDRNIGIVNAFPDRRTPRVWKAIIALQFAGGSLLLVSGVVIAGAGRDDSRPASFLLYLAVIWVVALTLVQVAYQRSAKRRATALLKVNGVEAGSAQVTKVAYYGSDGWYVDYVYDATGTAFKGHRYFKHQPTAKVGDPLTVIYDPDHPDVHGWLA